MARYLIMGAILGFVVGLVFTILYFGPGQITTPMAYIHEISGAGLGILGGWITALYKTRK
ncbi:hypothetical protein ACFLZI_01110 [Nitrospirota bacterium]